MTIESGFFGRYDAVMAKWPVPHEGLDLVSRFGTTHVNAFGRPDLPPVVLLPGGRSTSAVWYATVGALADRCRGYAVDTLGDAGRSVASGEPIRSIGDVVRWLDDTLDQLGVAAAVLVGHSLGAHYATRYALHAPHRVTRLALLDPTNSFCGNRPSFMIRAIPLLAGRGPHRYRNFADWEMRGRPVDPAFRDLWSGPFGGTIGGAWPKRLTAAEVARLTMPVLVFAASESRQNDPRRLTRGAADLPDGRVVAIEGASHFMIPQEFPDEINPPLVSFLTS